MQAFITMFDFRLKLKKIKINNDTCKINGHMLILIFKFTTHVHLGF
jgi:hypothetical protein